MSLKAMTQKPYDPSLDRQLLDRLGHEFLSILRFFCDGRPILHGSLRTISRRCGKPRCRCNKGQLHRTTVFVDQYGERPVLHKVTGPDLHSLRSPTSEYRRIRGLRARLSHLHRDVLAACDRLTRFRLQKGLSAHPLPPGRSP